jgi:hypothetical protein
LINDEFIWNNSGKEKNWMVGNPANFAPVGRSTFISKYNRFEKNCIGVFLEHGSRLHQMKNNWCWLILKPVHVPDNLTHPAMTIEFQ